MALLRPWLRTRSGSNNVSSETGEKEARGAMVRTEGVEAGTSFPVSVVGSVAAWTAGMQTLGVSGTRTLGVSKRTVRSEAPMGGGEDAGPVRSVAALATKPAKAGGLFRVRATVSRRSPTGTSWWTGRAMFSGSGGEGEPSGSGGQTTAGEATRRGVEVMGICGAGGARDSRGDVGTSRDGSGPDPHREASAAAMVMSNAGGSGGGRVGVDSSAWAEWPQVPWSRVARRWTRPGE
jgi:hypothetical protein